MPRWIVHCLRALLIIVLVAVILAGLIMIHFTLWNRGGIALKTGHGALALKYLKPLAWLGDEQAQQIVGDMYAYGSEGTQKNDGKALHWFHRMGFFNDTLFERGVDRAAAYELQVARTYACGDMGVGVDPAESFKWLKRAAQDGLEEAATLFGKIQQSASQSTVLCPCLRAVGKLIWPHRLSAIPQQIDLCPYLHLNDSRQAGPPHRTIQQDGRAPRLLSWRSDWPRGPVGKTQVARDWRRLLVPPDVGRAPIQATCWGHEWLTPKRTAIWRIEPAGGPWFWPAMQRHATASSGGVVPRSVLGDDPHGMDDAG